MMIDLNAKMEELNTLLDTEEAFVVQSPEDYDASERRRVEIEQIMHQINTGTQAPYARLANFSRLPPKDLMYWAQAIQQMPNLAFLVLDTTGLESFADIIRILLVDGSGEPIYHQVIRSERASQRPNTSYTGITQEQMDAAPTLTECWPMVFAALKGRYTLAYGHDWVQERLNDNTSFYALSPIHLIGDCLQQTAAQYFRSLYNKKLADLCARIGHPLPTPALAIDRAKGQIALLNAMANGITQVKLEPVADVPDLDDHPF